jgi:hypothetical protein
VNGCDEEEKKKKSKSRVLLSLSHKYTHTDGLSLDSLYKASAYIFFSLSCLYFVSTRINLFALLLIFTTFFKKKNTIRKKTFFLLYKYILPVTYVIIEIRGSISSLMDYEHVLTIFSSNAPVEFDKNTIPSSYT